MNQNTAIPKGHVFPAGNIYDKYHSKNPLVQFLTKRFLNALDDFLRPRAKGLTLLEVGCGEGHLLEHIHALGQFSSLEGTDVCEEILKKARELYPGLCFRQANAGHLNYPNQAFDCVVACEVLEHLDDVKGALAEIRRVMRAYCVISVPIEPLWRILNMARGKYWCWWGNTPGHQQHWSKRSFLELLKDHFRVVDVRYPLPWQIALCEKK